MGGLSTGEVGASLDNERAIAHARSLLAAVSYFALYLEPTALVSHAVVVSLLATIYLLASVSFAWILRTQRSWSRRQQVVTHVADMLFVSVLTSLTGASSSPLFLLLVFVVLTAAYRWDFVETIATTAALLMVLIAQAAVLARMNSSHPALQFDANVFVLHAGYMVVAGSLLAYLAWRHKQLGVESGVVARLLGRLRAETELPAALGIAARELVPTFGASGLAVALREQLTGSTSLFVMSPESGDLERVPLSEEEAGRYLFEASSAFMLVTRRAGTAIELAIDATGVRVPEHPPVRVPVAGRAFACAAAVSIAAHDDWLGRVFLFDPSRRHRNLRSLRLLQRIVTAVVPALHGISLGGQIRERARATERARLARDLHDVSIQSLLAVEMELMALSRRTPDGTMRAALSDVRSHLLSAIQTLRHLIDSAGARGQDVTAITERIAETLARFQLESGIRARFISVTALVVPVDVGRELLFMVRAALSNVRRHSGATRVDVSLESGEEGCVLRIDDDGNGFGGGFRVGPRALKTPWSIRERVSGLGGQLVVERRSPTGLRLEIRLPPLVRSA